MGTSDLRPKLSSPLIEMGSLKSPPPSPTKEEDLLRTNKNSPTPLTDLLPRPKSATFTMPTTTETLTKDLPNSKSSNKLPRLLLPDLALSTSSSPKEDDQRRRMKVLY